MPAEARSAFCGFSPQTSTNPKRARALIFAGRRGFEGRAEEWRRRNELDLMRVSSFLTRERRSENISECRSEERHRFEPAKQNERNQKPSWRGQSVLSRLFREERSRRGLALDSNDPDFRERREKRRSGRHSRLYGEIVLAHVHDGARERFLARGTDSMRNTRRRREAKNASRQHGESRLGEIPHGPFEA